MVIEEKLLVLSLFSAEEKRIFELIPELVEKSSGLVSVPEDTASLIASEFEFSEENTMLISIEKTVDRKYRFHFSANEIRIFRGSEPSAEEIQKIMKA